MADPPVSWTPPGMTPPNGAPLKRIDWVIQLPSNSLTGVWWTGSIDKSGPLFSLRLEEARRFESEARALLIWQLLGGEGKMPNARSTPVSVHYRQ